VEAVSEANQDVPLLDTADQKLMQCAIRFTEMEAGGVDLAYLKVSPDDTIESASRWVYVPLRATTVRGMLDDMGFSSGDHDEDVRAALRELHEQRAIQMAAKEFNRRLQVMAEQRLLEMRATWWYRLRKAMAEGLLRWGRS
jgi:hypothetical protein